jgi:glycerol-3-phosphate O-acyltransferase 1/2
MPADAERARRLAAHIEAEYSSDEEMVVDNSSRVYLPTNSHCERLVIMSALAPFAHTYLAVAHTLHQLLRGEVKVESEFIKLCIKEIRGRVESGQCKYGEAVSTDSVRNCLKIMQKQSLIDLTNSHGVKLVGLNPVHDSIENVVNIINKFEKYVPL